MEQLIRHGKFIATLASLVAPIHANSAIEEQKHESIVTAATEFIEQYYSVESSNPAFEIIVKQPDKRTRLAACNQPLEAFWPYDPGNKKIISVGVRCDGESQWKLYLNAELSLLEEVAVLTTSVRAGELLDSSMVTTRRINTLKLRSPAIVDIKRYAGMKFNRSLRSGAPLLKSQLDIPATIERGDFITILSGEGIVQVVAKGYALSDGSLHDQIRVRNTDSKKVIQAEVIEPGFVRAVK